MSFKQKGQLLINQAHSEVYTKGEVVTDLSRKSVYLILGYEANGGYGRYNLMSLKGRDFKDIFGREFPSLKGTESSMPADTINKQFLLLEL